MNFDTWYDLYSHPYETREDAAERFADEQGYENPAEKQGFLDSLPEYETITPLDQQAEMTMDSAIGLPLKKPRPLLFQPITRMTLMFLTPYIVELI